MSESVSGSEGKCQNTSNFFVYDFNRKAPYNRFKITNYLELASEHFFKVVMLRNRAELANYHHVEVYNYFDKANYDINGKWNDYGYGSHFYVPVLAIYRSQRWRNENLYEGSFSQFPSVLPDPEGEDLVDVAIEMEKKREFMNSWDFYGIDDGDDVYVVYTEKLSDWNQKKLAPYCQCDYHRCWYWNPLKFLYNKMMCGCIQEFVNKMPPQEVIDLTRMAYNEAMKKETNVDHRKLKME